LAPKYVKQRRVKLVLRTTQEVVKPQPEAAGVLEELLAWIDRADEAARRNEQKPPTCRVNGQPLFPNTSWWLTEMERRRPAEAAGTVDNDGQLDEEDLTLDPAAAGAASSGSSSASADDDSDASLPAGPPAKRGSRDRSGLVAAGGLPTPGRSFRTGSTTAARAVPAPAAPERDAGKPLCRVHGKTSQRDAGKPLWRMHGKTSQGSLRATTPVPQPCLLQRGRAFPGEGHAIPSTREPGPTRLVLGSAAVPDLPAEIRRRAKRGDTDIDIVPDPSAAPSSNYAIPATREPGPTRLVVGSAAIPDLPAEMRRRAKRGDIDIDIVHDPSAAPSSN